MLQTTQTVAPAQPATEAVEEITTRPATQRVAASTQPQTAPATQTAKSVGKPIDRVDGRLKVTGHAKYAADFAVKDVAFAVAFTSTIASGKVRSIDTQAAMKMPGVLGVLTHENAPRLFTISSEHNPGRPGQIKMPVQEPAVDYWGQHLGVVIATTLAQATHAAEQIAIEYEKAESKVHFFPEQPDAFQPEKMGRGDAPTYKRGQPDETFSASPVRIEATYSTAIENHNPMELSATIAAWDGDRLTLYDATQWIYGVQSVISTWLGLASEKVRVIDPFVGGGFGCKGSIWPHEILAAMAAKLVSQPVKLVLSRGQMFSCIGYRPRTVQKIRLGAQADGRLTSIIHDGWSQTSIWKEPWVEAMTSQTRMLYSCPNVRTAQWLVPVNANAPTQMRAPGHATGTFALEVAMDELAVQLKMDPIELRLKNYAERDESKDKPFSSKSLRACYEQGAERFGWKNRKADPGSVRDKDGALIGMGMATATYPTNRSESSARVRLLADGRAIVSTASHDLGTGTYTSMTQVASDALGIAIDRIKVELGDSTLPSAAVSGGSQTTASVGPAVKAACLKAIASLKERAIADPKSPTHAKPAKEIQVEDGRIFFASDPSIGEPVTELLRRNGSRPIEASSESRPGGGAEETGEPGEGKPKQDYSQHAWGAQFIEVRIDQRTREIRVTRALGAFAAGRIINPKTARSQLLGGIVWGLGMGLFEETHYDPTTGKIVNNNLADYLVPVNKDVPWIEVITVEENDPHVNPLGAKGVGELGITGVAAAISNAFFNATGKRLRDVPIRLDQLLSLPYDSES